MNLRPVQATIAIAIMFCGPLLHAGDANTKKEVFFGTTHAHSSWSIDAFGLGNQGRKTVLALPVVKWSLTWVARRSNSSNRSIFS